MKKQIPSKEVIKSNKNLESFEVSFVGHAYMSYPRAIRKRRRDEVTVFDPKTGKFYNVKIYKRRKWGVF